MNVFTVVIPARYGSSRFPGKPLALINGKPMIEHVVERASEAGAKRVIVATDNDSITEAVSSLCDVCMTSSHHNSGTERLAEVVCKEGLDDSEIVVNVQGDEPFIPATNIAQVADNLVLHQTDMATLGTPINSAEEVLNPNIVKAVANRLGKAMYFSRSAIPFDRDRMMKNPLNNDPNLYLRHIGLYAYTAGYIKKYVNYEASQLEDIESLEQLRALWYGDSIHIELAKAPPPIGIDTPEDLVHLINTLNKG